MLTLASRCFASTVTGKVQAEYIFIDADGDVRSKCRTVDSKKATVAQLPDWNYDGSSTEQAPGEDSEVIMKPKAVFKDPFRGGDNILVLTDTYTPGGTPLPTNTRKPAMDIFESRPEAAGAWFGLEQEYTLFNLDMVTPLGWPEGGYPGPQGPYYCGAGADRSYGRAISEAHYKACLFAGLEIGGTNAEVMPGQWEYQIGPCLGIEQGDHLWMSRYVMMRVCELFGVVVSFHPKPMLGDWNGAGCHTNFSTKVMREVEGAGYDAIIAALEKMKAPGKQQEHIAAYDASGGEDNKLRLTGAHETASIDAFTFGVANRGCSARIPRDTEAAKKGYFEDRRPASNCDPYVVTAKIVETCCL